MKTKITWVVGFLLLCFGSVTNCFAGQMLIWSFEKKEDMEKLGTQFGVEIEQSKDYATDREYSAKVTFPPGGYPGILISPEEEDWSDYVYLSFDIYNPGKEVFGMRVQIFDEAGESILFHLGVGGEIPLSHKIRLPSFFEVNPKFNLKKVKKFTFSKGPEDIEKVLYLDNIRLEPVSKILFQLPILSDFETKEDLSKWGYNNALIHQSKDYTGEKDYGAKITFLSKVDWGSRLVCYLENGVTSKDWSGYEKFAFDIFNPGQEVFNFYISFDNFTEGDARLKRKTFTYGVEKQKEKDIEIPLADISQGIDISQITSFNISTIGLWLETEKDIIIYIDNFRLIPKKR